MRSIRSQTGLQSQAFLKSQTHLLKGLLMDKGGQGCRRKAITDWIIADASSAGWLDKEMKALVGVYESLLLDPRPFNLKCVKAKGKPVQLQWRVANEKGDQVVVALFAIDCQELGRLPRPLQSTLYQIEEWRMTLNFLCSLHHYALESASSLLTQLDELTDRRKVLFG